MVITSAIITILASFILTLIYWRVNKVYVFLLVLMLSLGLFAILHQLFFYNGDVLPATILYTHFVPVFYLPGPMLFFFVRGILEDREELRMKHRGELLHFIPSLLALLGILPYLFLSFDYKLTHVAGMIDDPMLFKNAQDNWLLPNWANAILRPLLLMAYGFISLYLIRRHQQRNKRLQAHFLQMKITLQWLYALVAFMLVIGICYLILVVIYFSVNDISRARTLSSSPSVVVGILLLFIPIMVAIFPQLLYGIPRDKKAKTKTGELLSATENEKRMILPQIISGEADRKSSREEPPLADPLEHEALEILSFIEARKLYLDPGFNLEALAKTMEIPRNHLYYCFSNLINEKFTTYRTRLRVEHAKELLINGVAKRLSMEGIAVESGFSSRSRFFSSFKEITGLTPMEFLNQNQSIEQIPTSA
jgi:AraC-like DNA-binding protein